MHSEFTFGQIKQHSIWEQSSALELEDGDVIEFIISAGWKGYSYQIKMHGKTYTFEQPSLLKQHFKIKDEQGQIIANTETDMMGRTKAEVGQTNFILKSINIWSTHMAWVNEEDSCLLRYIMGYEGIKQVDTIVIHNTKIDTFTAILLAFIAFRSLHVMGGSATT